jgi:hypothetical protein
VFLHPAIDLMDSMWLKAHWGEYLKAFGAIVIVKGNPALLRQPQCRTLKPMTSSGAIQAQPGNKLLAKKPVEV